MHTCNNLGAFRCLDLYASSNLLSGRPVSALYTCVPYNLPSQMILKGAGCWFGVQSLLYDDPYHLNLLAGDLIEAFRQRCLRPSRFVVHALRLQRATDGKSCTRRTCREHASPRSRVLLGSNEHASWVRRRRWCGRLPGHLWGMSMEDASQSPCPACMATHIILLDTEHYSTLLQAHSGHDTRDMTSED
jgi:hypothetical protein